MPGGRTPRLPEGAERAAHDLVASGLDPYVVAQRLRVDFLLSPGLTAMALNRAGIPLRECKQAVDQTLSPQEADTTAKLRQAAIEALDLDDV